VDHLEQYLAKGDRSFPLADAIALAPVMSLVDHRWSVLTRVVGEVENMSARRLAAITQLWDPRTPSAWI
jgi:hypothetical protein